MAYSSNNHATASSSSGHRPKPPRQQSREGRENAVLNKTKRSPNEQVSDVSGTRPNDERRQSWLGVGKDIFKRQSLQLPPSSYNFKSPDTNTKTIDNLPLQKNNVNTQTSPNSFAARSSRKSLVISPVAYDRSPIEMSQSSEQSQLHPYADSTTSTDQTSICHSPTWGEEKSKKKQTGWTWKKGSNSKSKQEQDIETIPKKSKRLNKKPPSAMETQRHSSLVNSSGPDTLQMDRRFSSSSGSFTQAMRGFLSRRSSQTTTPESSRPVSRSRPQSSSQELKAKELSHKLSMERKRQENETRVGDVGKRSSQKMSSSNDLTNKTNSQATIGPAPLSTPPQSSGRESKGPTPPPKSPSDLPRSTSVPSSISRMFGKKDNAAGGYKYPGRSNKLTREHKPRSDAKSGPNTWLTQNFNNFRSNSSTEVSQSTKDSQNTGGYVERERRLHRQRSIARFQDEIAVKSAYDQFLTESQLPPTPQDSSESVDAARSDSVQGLQHQTLSRLGNENYLKYNKSTQSNSIPLQDSAQPPLDYAAQSTEARSIPEKLTLSSGSSNFRPSPGVIQSSNYGPRNQSLPALPPKDQYQSTDAYRQPKDSTLTGTPKSDSGTRKISSAYQLPPISATSTSPILSAFLDQSNGGLTPPVLSLNNSTSKTNTKTARKPVPATSAPEVRTLGGKKRTELLIASENAEGLTRKTSLKKSRSDPELKVPELKIDPPPPDLPSLDFLPELKHQPLTRPKRTSRVTFAPGAEGAPLSPSQFPLPSPTEIAKRGGTGLRTTKWSSISNGALVGADAGPPKPIAKMFVICCKCKFWHDLPSKIYEAMALPQAVSKEDDIAGGIQHRKGNTNQADDTDAQVKGLEGKIFTQVKCPWCEHGMSTSCCAGWTAVIYLHERHH